MRRTTVDRNGRVLLPAPVRHALGLQYGSELAVSVEDGRVVLAPSSAAWAAVQRLAVGSEPGDSVVDELLAERRSEARRDGGDGVGDLVGA